MILVPAIGQPLSGGAPASAGGEKVSEYQVMAAYLYNFAKFVDWPPEAFANAQAPIVIGVVGDDQFEIILMQTLTGKTVANRPLVMKHFKTGEDVRRCHILFIGDSERKRLPQILLDLKGSQVLTVAQMDQFLQQGGMIRFLLDENRVRFEVNLGIAEQSRLRISSKLLAVAKNVRG